MLVSIDNDNAAVSEYRKNHYVPIYYLKHFTDSRNHFWVYDKKSKFPLSLSYKSPSQVCFEKDRNTIFSLPGNSFSTVVEKSMYSVFDSMHAKTFDLLAKCDKFEWPTTDVQNLEMFIPMLYWRSPVSDKLLLKKIQEAELIHEAFGVGLYDKSGNMITDKKFNREMLDDTNIQKAVRGAISAATFGRPHPIYDKLEWILLKEDDIKPNLTSDNPIIFQVPPKDFIDFRSSLILPLSNDRTLIRVNEKRKTNNRHLKFFQDIATIHNAHRYVMCRDKYYLNHVIQEYKVHEKLGLMTFNKDWLFKSYETLDL